ncbi:hypothetical protein LXL04_005287 [Taraxacum kok-saghyz]
MHEKENEKGEEMRSSGRFVDVCMDVVDWAIVYSPEQENNLITANLPSLTPLPSTESTGSRMATNSNIGAHKRCQCKKSKCLQLHCKCFAGGLYCAEACRCKGCLNQPVYGRLVQVARDNIKKRVPLAFSPKIPSLEDGGEKTRKGCNCRKLTCCQHYCGCYKAKVGCRSDCRCEGCKNVYGMKGGKCNMSLVTKNVLPYTPSEAGSSSNNEMMMMIGTSIEDEYDDMELPSFEQLEFLERFNTRHDR